MNQKAMSTAFADAQALISTLELPYLRELQQLLAQEIRNRDAQAKTEAIAQMHQIAASVGMSLNELLKIAPMAAKRVGKPADIKYRNPADTSQVWSGRGRQPFWVRDWEASHGNLDALKVAA